jgi:hypothetical protein
MKPDPSRKRYEVRQAPTSTVAVSQIDFCTDTLLLAAQGSAVLAPGQFQIDGKITAPSPDGTTNFTPEPALVAELASVRQGELDIIRQ